MTEQKKKALSGKKKSAKNREKDGPDKSNSAAGKFRKTVVLLLAIVGVAIYVWDLYPDREAGILSQMAFRLSIVLGTVWLAFSQLEIFFRNFSVGLLLIILLVIFVIAKNPLILVTIVALCVAIGSLTYVVRIFNEG